MIFVAVFNYVPPVTAVAKSVISTITIMHSYIFETRITFLK